MNDLVKRLRAVVDDYDRDAADAAEQGEVWPHDPHTEVDLPVSLVRACADRIAALEAERDRLREFAAWVDTWVSNPVGAYSVSALDGLFGMARDRLGAIDAARRALDGSEG